MSPLAVNIYALLRTRMRFANPALSYGDLVGNLPSPFNSLDADSPVLAIAVEEVATACRVHGLPAITAMLIVSADPANDEPVSGELTRVRSSSYPPAL
jgi:hypothetical protein